MQTSSTRSSFRSLLACVVAACLSFAATAQSAPPSTAPYVGTFTDGNLTLELHDSDGNVAGEIVLGGKTYKLSGAVNSDAVTGSFRDESDHPFKFTAHFDGNVLLLESGGTTYRLKPQTRAVRPHAADAGTQPVAADIAPNAGPAIVKLVPWIIHDDPTWTNEEVSRGFMPAGWKCEAKVDWDLRCGFVGQLHAHFADASGLRAFDTYPGHGFYWSNVPGIQRQIPPGRMMGDVIIERVPADQFAAIKEYVIPKYLPELAHARIIKEEKRKDIATMVFNNMIKIPGEDVLVAAGRIRFEYEVDGQTIEEDVFAALTKHGGPRSGGTNWAVTNITSLRAPKGSLDEVATAQRMIIRSVRPGIAFNCKVDQFAAMLNNIKTEEIHEIGRRSALFAKMANEASDRQAAAYWDRQKVMSQMSDARAEYNRSLTPYNTGDGRKVEIPNEYDHAWINDHGVVMGTKGHYDPNKDPNQPEVGWRPMDIAR